MDPHLAPAVGGQILLDPMLDRVEARVLVQRHGAGIYPRDPEAAKEGGLLVARVLDRRRKPPIMRPVSQSLRERILSRRRIVLMRHGDVSYFDAEGLPVHPDHVPLNTAGRLQAAEARTALRSLSFDRAIATGLRRTEETASIVLEGRSLAVETLPALREIAPGPILDTSDPHFESRFTGALAAPVRPETTFLGGESFGALQERVLPALRNLLLARDWRNLLVVAHGGVNRVILLHALGAGLDSMGRLEQEPGCVNVIDEIDGGQLLVRLVNHTPEEPLKGGIRATTMEKIFLEHQDAHVAAAARIQEKRP